jgi:ribokinase
MSTGSVLVVGSLNADLVAYAPRLPGDGETVHGHRFVQAAGGKGLNQAVAAARAGAATTLVGCIGEDDLGAFLREQAHTAGVDVRAVEQVPGPSGVALISVSDAATNRIIVVAGANGRLDAARIARALDTLAAPDLVLTQLETPVDGVAAALRAGRRSGAVTVLNPAPAADLPEELLADVDWLIPNEFEAALVLGTAAEITDTATAVDVARALQTRGPRGVLITLGERGAVCVDPDGEARAVPAFAVAAVDPTAAGDAFCGVFAASLASGATIEVAVRRACAGGALATTRRGAVPSIPTAVDVDTLLGTPATCS